MTGEAKGHWYVLCFIYSYIYTPLYCWQGKGHWQQVRIQNTRLDIPKVKLMMAWQKRTVSTHTTTIPPAVKRNR